MTLAGLPLGAAHVAMRETLAFRETVNVMGDGTVRQRVVGPKDRILDITIPRLTDGYWDGLKAIIEQSKNTGATMVMVDEYATAYTVRLWGDSLVGERRLGRFWSVRLSVRVEN